MFCQKNVSARFWGTSPQCGNSRNVSDTQILREINFGDSRMNPRSAKSENLLHFEALNFESFCIFTVCEGWSLPNQQNSEFLKWQKKVVFEFLILKNWFHVKSKWGKNP